MNISIRPATIRDLHAILSLYAQPELDDGNVLTAQKAQEIFSEMTASPNFTVYVAESNSRIIGTFEHVIIPRLVGSSAIVEDVAVAPEWQGKGVGKQMMDFAVSKSIKAGCQQLTLSSNLKREKAHRFYENLGFNRDGYSFLPQPRPYATAANSFEIRAATERDIPSLHIFQKQLQVNQSSGQAQQNIARLLIDMKQYRYLKIYIASVDEEFAGMFQMLVMPNLGHMGTPSAVVEDFFITEEFRNGGIEEQMLNFALLESKKAGCYKLALSMNEELNEKVDAPEHGLRFTLKLA